MPAPTPPPVPAPPTAEEAREALRAVIDPELGADIVELGMVRQLDVGPDGVVSVSVALTVAGCPLRAQIERDVRGRLGGLPGVSGVALSIGEMNPEEKSAVMARARWKAREEAPATSVPAGTRVLAVASGKGGVGKSSVTVNLAVALARRGLTVGILDADIWGFSVPRLLGMDGGVEARGGKMVPLERPVPGGGGRPDGVLRVLSMGFLADEDRAIMWRGLVLNRAVQQFLQDAHWGDLDYLLIDLPPGTGDVQMGLARMLPRAEMLIVTTPPLAAQKVAARAADMARRGYLRVAGVVENMSDFTCDHGTTYALFGSGGGARLAGALGVPLVGTVPLHPDLSAAGDDGRPVALDDGELGAVFAGLARAVAEDVAPVVDSAGCTARLLDHVAAAVAAADGRPTAR
ncbi:MAG TPA: Mrp/NBP35 family ATP-binding protein [Acidimicrobiales bacterium]|nr:Mrp/NBP35 family ATP-binding protein [Acidimicrobiales bacterium]